jgi:hypothetical protein
MLHNALKFPKNKFRNLPVKHRRKKMFNPWHSMQAGAATSVMLVSAGTGDAQEIQQQWSFVEKAARIRAPAWDPEK